MPTHFKVHEPSGGEDEFGGGTSAARPGVSRTAMTIDGWGEEIRVAEEGQMATNESQSTLVANPLGRDKRVHSGGISMHENDVL